jgi:hypothetical protein
MRQAKVTTFTFKSLLLLGAALAAMSVMAVQDSAPEFKELRGSFMLYSLGLGDPQPARRDDNKIAFEITGDAARKMFDSLGRDVRDACTEGSGVRVRRKENLSCQRENAGEYRCSFGFDLRTGKSIGGSVC